MGATEVPLAICSRPPSPALCHSEDFSCASVPLSAEYIYKTEGSSTITFMKTSTHTLNPALASSTSEKS